MVHTRRASLAGITLAYETRGVGEPAVLIHAGMFADWFAPLLDEPALTNRHWVVSYQRVNYGASSHVAGPVTIADQAAHCRALMTHLGLERAHLVGHSSGGSIALQLALESPDAVGSLALLEPARAAGAGGAHAPASHIAEAMERYRAGDKAGAIDAFMGGVCGPEYRPHIVAALPAGAFEQAVADADGFFGQELPAVRAWPAIGDGAYGLGQPVLAVVGADSSPAFQQGQQVLLARFPHAEAFTLPGATHLLHVQQPRAMAEALSAFFARHPLTSPHQSADESSRAGRIGQ
jgi:pimeloyl-ACP methyl ester carboxylesterase